MQMKVAFGLLFAALVVKAEDECTTTALSCKEVRYTTTGCQCACPWTMSYSGSGPQPTGPGTEGNPCTEGCCNPDNEPAGDWCFLAVTQYNVDNGCIPDLQPNMQMYGTCAPKSDPAPTPPAPTPAATTDVCAAADQTCVDPDPLNPGDWTCVCKAPLVGVGQQTPAVCTTASPTTPTSIPTGAPVTTQQPTTTTQPATTAQPTTTAQPASPSTNTPATPGVPDTPQDCGAGGSRRGDCCICKLGWKKDASGSCTECAKGFYGSKYGYCTNTRPGSMCVPGQAAPLGCGRGSCTLDGESFVFPCNCGSTGYDESTFCENKKTCLPNGPAVYTPFPNRPVADEPFNILLVGCELASNDEYLVIPTWKDGKKKERNMCSTKQAEAFAGGCSFQSGEVMPSANCSQGVHVTGSLATYYDNVKRSNARATITGVVLSKEYLDANERMEFTVCKKDVSMLPSGDMVDVWRAVDGHNEHVSERDESFVIDMVRNTRSAPGMDGECCEGLKVGSLCLPLWAFLLLWLLMACCLGVLGYAMHKNKNEIEGIKNNQKYENFGQDAEMLALAAGNASDDDL